MARSLPGKIYTYDNNGNMTSGPDFSDPGQVNSRTITFNADNMQTVITHSSGGTTNLTYDGEESRTKKSVQGGGTTYYIGEHFEVINGTAVKYIFAGNLRIAMVSASGKTYFHKDHLGSCTVMTDASGLTVETTVYMPYGHMRAHTGTAQTNYKFTDQELDPESGLYNYGARLYDPMIGRFISPDIFVQAPFDPQNLNRYSYCFNNPLIYVDPSGNFGFLSAIIFTSIFYAVRSGVQNNWDFDQMVKSGIADGMSYLINNIAGPIAGIIARTALENQMFDSDTGSTPIAPIPSFMAGNNLGVSGNQYVNSWIAGNNDYLSIKNPYEVYEPTGHIKMKIEYSLNRQAAKWGIMANFFALAVKFRFPLPLPYDRRIYIEAQWQQKYSIIETIDKRSLAPVTVYKKPIPGTQDWFYNLEPTILHEDVGVHFLRPPSISLEFHQNELSSVLEDLRRFHGAEILRMLRERVK